MDEQVPRLTVVMALEAVSTAIGDGVSGLAAADSLLIEAWSSAPAAVEAGLAALRDAGWHGAVLLAGSPSVAGALRIGVVLPEHGMGSAEARRELGPGVPLGREIASAAAAALAVGLDFVIVDAIRLGASGLREVVESGWSATLARVSTVDEARMSLAAGVDGVVVSLVDAGTLGEIVALLPVREVVAASVLLNDAQVRLEPDSSVTDLLQDAGLEHVASVRVNGIAVLRRAWDDRMLETGDRIETTPAD